MVCLCSRCTQTHCKVSTGPALTVYCISCNNNSHPSQDRNCLEFIRRCAIYDDWNPENAMPYYLTNQDWTMTVRPDRIQIDKRFP